MCLHINRGVNRWLVGWLLHVMWPGGGGVEGGGVLDMLPHVRVILTSYLCENRVIRMHLIVEQ